MPSVAQSLWTYHSSLLIHSRRPAAVNEARLPQQESDKLPL